MNDIRWRSSASNEMLLERALLLKNIRAFFDARGVIEVETPVLSHHATTDPHLDSLSSRFRDETCYLNTFPPSVVQQCHNYSNIVSYDFPIIILGDDSLLENRKVFRIY